MKKETTFYVNLNFRSVDVKLCSPQGSQRGKITVATFLRPLFAFQFACSQFNILPSAKGYEHESASKICILAMKYDILIQFGQVIFQIQLIHRFFPVYLCRFFLKTMIDYSYLHGIHILYFLELILMDAMFSLLFLCTSKSAISQGHTN